MRHTVGFVLEVGGVSSHICLVAAPEPSLIPEVVLTSSTKVTTHFMTCFPFRCVSLQLLLNQNTLLVTELTFFLKVFVHEYL